TISCDLVVATSRLPWWNAIVTPASPTGTDRSATVQRDRARPSASAALCKRDTGQHPLQALHLAAIEIGQRRLLGERAGEPLREQRIAAVLDLRELKRLAERGNRVGPAEPVRVPLHAVHHHRGRLHAVAGERAVEEERLLDGEGIGARDEHEGSVASGGHVLHLA